MKTNYDSAVRLTNGSVSSVNEHQGQRGMQNKCKECSRVEYTFPLSLFRAFLHLFLGCSTLHVESKDISRS